MIFKAMVKKIIDSFSGPRTRHRRGPILEFLYYWLFGQIFYYFDQILKTKARETVKLDFHRPPAPIFTSRMYFFIINFFKKK